MNGEFEDDVFGADGKTEPTKAQMLLVRGYLQRHNRQASYGAIADELVARGFVTSKATVGRKLKEGGTNPPQKKAPEAKAAKRNNARRDRRKRGTDAAPAVEVQSELAKGLLGEVNAIVTSTIKSIFETETSGAMIAMRENRTRMALNIILMEAMASKPELLLLDMRGAAALVDAMTVGVKLSGGASIEVIKPGGSPQAGEPVAGDMKDITPPKPVVVNDLADELSRFRKQRANGNGHAA